MCLDISISDLVATLCNCPETSAENQPRVSSLISVIISVFISPRRGAKETIASDNSDISACQYNLPFKLIVVIFDCLLDNQFSDEKQSRLHRIMITITYTSVV